MQELKDKEDRFKEAKDNSSSSSNINSNSSGSTSASIKRSSVKNWSTSCVENYEKIVQVGQGTFGKVYKARLLSDSEKLFALKKILMENEKEGFPITAIREIIMLKRLNHSNIIPLREIATSKPSEKNHYQGSVYLVFDYMEHDLGGLLERNISLSQV